MKIVRLRASLPASLLLVLLTAAASAAQTAVAGIATGPAGEYADS